MAGRFYLTASGRRSVSRRRMLGAVTLGAGSAAFLAACSGDKASDGSGAATQSGGTQAAGGQASTEIFLDAKTKKVSGKESIDELRERFHSRHFKQLPGQKNGPKYGGTLRWNSNVPTSWDLVGPVASTLASYSMFHNSLVTFEIGDMSENLNFLRMEGDLARAWEQPDRQTLTFKLNDGIKWQNVAPVNGRAFTSEDVKYAVEAYQKAPVQSTIYRDVDVVETPDANTAVFRMKQPVAYFLNVLMQPHNLIFSREQHQSADGLKSGPIGTGPFIYEGGQDRVGYKGRKNPDYFKKDPWTGKQLPYVDRIETQYYTDINASIAAFRDKQIDTYYPINHTLWMDVLKTNPEVITQFNTPAPSAQPFFPVRNDRPPFNDVRVRRALSMAIDREAIIAGPVSGMGGYGYGLDWTYFGQEWPWTLEQLGPYMKYDPEGAKKLLAEAGFSNGLGRKIELYHPVPSTTNYSSDIAALVADMWKKNLGIEVVETVPPDAAAFNDKYFNVKYDDVIVAGQVGPGTDPDAYTFDALHSKSPRNYFKVNDPELDRLTEAQRLEFDVPKRQQILREVMNRDLDQMYRIWGVTQYKINTRHPYVYNAVDEVHAWGPVGWGARVTQFVWFDK